jgi:hypothetical protein
LELGKSEIEGVEETPGVLLTETDGVELIDGVTLTEIDGVTLIVGVTLGVDETRNLKVLLETPGV